MWAGKRRCHWCGCGGVCRAPRSLRECLEGISFLSSSKKWGASTDTATGATLIPSLPVHAPRLEFFEKDLILSQKSIFLKVC